MKSIVWFGFVLGALSATGEVILTKPGRRVIFECPVSTYNSLVWRHRNNLIISINGKTGFSRKGTGDITERSRMRGTDLEVSNVKGEDAGTFSYEADRTYQEHTLLVVSVSASPPGDLQLGSSATLQCQVTGLNPEATVQWKRPGGGPQTVPDPVQLKSVAHSDAGTWECLFSHGGATYNESIMIKVKAPAPETSAPSPSQSSKDVREPTCPDCDGKPPSEDAPLLLLGLSWWVWVAIGVGCLVVVLLMVFVIVFCKRIRRRKRKLQKMKNGHQKLKPKLYCQCNRPTAAAKPQQGRRREKPSAPPLQPLLME